eukprot:2109688-Prymnesium_polylepis.1
MLRHVRPGDTIVDCGGNFGSFGVYFAAAMGPKGRLFAFEPQEIMRHYYTANLVLNGLASRHVE